MFQQRCATRAGEKGLAKQAPPRSDPTWIVRPADGPISIRKDADWATEQVSVGVTVSQPSDAVDRAITDAVLAVLLDFGMVLPVVLLERLSAHEQQLTASNEVAIGIAELELADHVDATHNVEHPK